MFWLRDRWDRKSSFGFLKFNTANYCSFPYSDMRLATCYQLGNNFGENGTLCETSTKD